MRREKRLPSRLAISLGSGCETGVSQDALDGVSADVVPDIEQRTADAGVAPARIIGGHGADEFGDTQSRALHGTGPSHVGSRIVAPYEVVEYALARTTSPALVAEYQDDASAEGAPPSKVARALRAARTRDAGRRDEQSQCGIVGSRDRRPKARPEA